MPARPIIGLIKVALVVSYFLATYILILWVTISLAITSHGQVKWAEGWERTEAIIRSYTG